MVTKAQIQANRRNAEKSTGPKTTEGKTTVSQNALKHGLTAQNPLIDGLSHIDYNLYHYEMIEELGPIGPMETMLAERIVGLSWRLKLSVQILNQTFELLNKRSIPRKFDKMTERMLHRVIGRPMSDENASDEDSALGRIAVKDFSNERVLDRLLLYERRLEHSLFKTLLEFQKISLMRKMGHNNTHRPGTDFNRS